MTIGPFAVPGYHVGDALTMLRQLPDESVNCCVTSPPYFNLRDYQVEGQIGMEETPEEYVEKLVAVFREVRRALRPDGTVWINLGDAYVTGPDQARDVHRIRDDKRGYRGDRLANGRGDQPAVLRQKTASKRPDQPKRQIVHGLKPKDMYGIPWWVAFALQADGWWLRSDIIWEKPNPMPEAVKDRPTRAHEYLFLLSKSEHYYYDFEAIKEPVTGGSHARGNGVNPKAAAAGKNELSADRKKVGFNERWRVKQNESFSSVVSGLVDERNKRSVWKIAPEPCSDAHFAVMPSKLVEPCILAGSPGGGLVLDPFGGSGTVGRVAEDLGRKWLLFDLNPAYAEIAKRRTAQTGILGRVVA